VTAETLVAASFHAVLLLARLGAAAMLLPGLGETDTPAAVRLALGLALVLLLLPVLQPGLPPVPDAPAEAVRLLLLEAATGIWLGLLARFVAYALVQTGQIVALMVGLSSPLQLDPALGAAGTATGRMFGLLAAVLVLATGLYELPLRALVDSYRLLPAGGGWPGGIAAEALAAAAGDSLTLGLRLAAPMVLLSILFNLGLALLARLAPQVQVFVVAAPAQLLAGLALLALLLPAMLAAWQLAAAEAFLQLPGSG